MTDAIKDYLREKLEARLRTIDFDDKWSKDKIQELTEKIGTLEAELANLRQELAQYRMDDESRQRTRADIQEALEELG